MKRTKLVLWIIILGFVALIIFQNKEFFLRKQSLGINLYFVNYHTPELHNAIIFLACFMAGVIVAYFFSLSERFKSNKMIKDLNSSVDSHLETISALKSELESLKKGTPGKQEDVSESYEEAKSA